MQLPPDLKSSWSISRVSSGSVLVWASATGLTALTGPFGTYAAFGIVGRLAYWGGIIGVAIGLGFALRAVLQRSMSAAPESQRFDIAFSLLFAASFGPILWAFNLWGLGGDIATLGFFLEHVLVVLLVSLVGVWMRDVFRRDRPEQGGEVPGHAFLSRLEGSLGPDLLRVSANDHYLHVATTLGEGRVLMRFRDALAELSDLPGYQIHRSHWVAHGAVRRVRRDGRRYVVDLVTEETLPVSSAYLDRLRADGFLD